METTIEGILMARAKAKKTKKKATRKVAATRKKAAPKKVAKRVKTTKRATSKRKAAPKKAAKSVKKVTPKTALKSALNKSQIMTTLAETTELSKKEIAGVFEELGTLIHRHLRKGGAGEFTVPGLMKCVVKRKPATKARKGINPFTGEEIMFKAKPARNVVKIRPLKKLKEMVE
jgi:nucleoid DNA-binding protein